jgi:LmbE family N-acetylglucosaminyl deacetylase
MSPTGANDAKGLSAPGFRLSNAGAEVFVPDGADGADGAEALARTTHLGICAHQDDLEIMAYDGILQCFGRADRWFTGVTVTDGRGSARNGAYRDFTDGQMIDVRKREQKKAATVGEFSAVVFLNHESARVKSANDAGVAADLDLVFAAANPEAVYTHNLADKHDTHVAVALRVVSALRRRPPEKRPRIFVGCEVWRDLDWLCDRDKVAMSVDAHPNLADALLGIYDSQIAGGKRYDLAARGRRLANATFFESHEVDDRQALIWGMDLAPLLADDDLDPLAFVETHIARFAEEVRARLRQLR